MTDSIGSAPLLLASAASSSAVAPGQAGQAGGLPGGPDLASVAQTLASVQAALGRLEDEARTASAWRTQAEREIARLGKEPAAAPPPAPVPAAVEAAGGVAADDDFAAQLQAALDASKAEAEAEAAADRGMPHLDSDSDDDEAANHITLSSDTLWVWCGRWSALVRGSEARIERFRANVERNLRPQLEARDWREVEGHLRLLDTLLRSAPPQPLLKDLRDRWWFLRESKRKGAPAAAAAFDRLRGASTLPQDVRDATLLSGLDGQPGRVGRAARAALDGAHADGAGGRRRGKGKKGDKKQGGGQRGGESRPGRNQF